MKIQITQLMAVYALIRNRDLGLLVGEPAGDWVAKLPRYRHLMLVFKGKEHPPWIDAQGLRVKEASVTVPDAKKGLSWEQIKKAASPYNWGRFCAKARLTNGRVMTLYGASVAEAQKKIKQIMTLSDTDHYALDVTEEIERHPELKKSNTKVYPAYATLLVRRESTSLTGRTDLSGKRWEETPIRFNLWEDVKPIGLGVLP